MEPTFYRVQMSDVTSGAVDADRVAELAHSVVAEHDPKQVPVTEFLGACYDAGLSWVNFPEGLGGLGRQVVHDAGSARRPLHGGRPQAALWHRRSRLHATGGRRRGGGPAGGPGLGR